MNTKRIKFQISRLQETFKSPKVSIPLGFIFGVFFGIGVIYITQSDGITLIAIIGGAVLSVIIERIYDFGKTFIAVYEDSHPLRKILETSGKEDTVIYISPFYRDLDNSDESKLYRYERDRVSLPLIAGTQFVYGKGDALAMSFVLSSINKIAPQKHQLLIEDDWQALDKWGRTTICIGAHNAKSREIFAKFSDTFYRFAFNYKAIVRTSNDGVKETNGKNYIPAVFQSKANDSSIIDYGIILKLRDQFHLDKKPIFVIAGIGDWGTAGAAYYFQNHYRELPYNDHTFSILIEVPSGYQSARQVDFEEVSNYIVD